MLTPNAVRAGLRQWRVALLKAASKTRDTLDDKSFLPSLELLLRCLKVIALTVCLVLGVDLLPPDIYQAILTV